jgi:hypothetical protein
VNRSRTVQNIGLALGTLTMLAWAAIILLIFTGLI